MKADVTLRGGASPHLLYIRSTRSYNKDRIGGLVPQDWRFSVADTYDLEGRELQDVDVLFLSGMHDQIFLKSIESKLLDYLSSGGHLLVNGHIILPWLPCLSPFKAVSPKPFTNWMIRPARRDECVQYARASETSSSCCASRFGLCGQSVRLTQRP